ncbi:MAG TPA: phosphohistidine phosphatase SixA [Candidatus Limnocylindrales bacterium]|nr:phosphohistidine phosphatase SixA [Candidatus Limnocylindrales bacterium]
MRVYFFRHGLAEANEDGALADADRQLTSRGVIRTEKAARFLDALGVRPGTLYSSPLVRARETAEILGEQLRLAVKIAPELAPGFGVEALEQLTQGLGEREEVMLVGHEPDFSSTIITLTGLGRVVMKKGGLARVDVTSERPIRGHLVMLLTPRLMDLRVKK